MLDQFKEAIVSLAEANKPWGAWQEEGVVVSTFEGSKFQLLLDAAAEKLENTQTKNPITSKIRFIDEIKVVN